MLCVLPPSPAASLLSNRVNSCWLDHANERKRREEQSNSGSDQAIKPSVKAPLIVTLAPNQHIRMISEGSCDTEDWRNGAENSGRNTFYSIF